MDQDMIVFVIRTKLLGSFCHCDILRAIFWRYFLEYCPNNAPPRVLDSHDGLRSCLSVFEVQVGMFKVQSPTEGF
jgi:hypothetical protein